MSALARIVSGSSAAWATILVSIVSQIALVPIYLTYWTPTLYGVWLSIISLTSLFQIFDTGHQQFLGFEFFKQGSKDPNKLGSILSAAIPFALLIAALQITSAFILIQAGLFYWLFSSLVVILGETVIWEAGFVLILSISVFGLFGSVGGILVRVLAPLGFYPRMAWWGVLSALGSALAPAVVVVSGSGIKEAGIALATWIVVYNLFLYGDMFRLLKRSQVSLVRPDFRLGLANLWKSQVLVITALLAMARTTGARIVLAPLAGASSLAAFATMRTGANLALQGLATITGPLMPELMRVLRERDQARTEGAFALVWLVLVAIMAPAVVVLQAIIEPLFVLWTRGQIEFQPILFGVLSLGVLVFAWAQPAMAVVTGNNLLRPQLVVAGVAAVVVVGGMMLLVPLMGILGAAVALLLAELFAAYRFRIVAGVWLQKHGLCWPRASSKSAALSVWISAIAMTAIIYLPIYQIFFLCVTLTALTLNLVAYWRSLPLSIRERARSINGRVRWMPGAV